jgi:hypothetical protein
MSLLTDFIQEETLLQHQHGRLLGVKMEGTAKCHPEEISGEDVECNWGCAKGVCRHLPISEKRTKSNFRESVKKAMDSNEALPVGAPLPFWQTSKGTHVGLQHSG